MRRFGAVLGLLGLAWLSAMRAPMWGSNERVWEDAVRAQGRSPRAWVNVGTARFQAGRLEDARAAWLMAWRVADGRDAQTQRTVTALVLTNLALLEATDGHYVAARAYALDVVARFPDWPPGRDLCERLACRN